MCIQRGTLLYPPPSHLRAYLGLPWKAAAPTVAGRDERFLDDDPDRCRLGRALCRARGSLTVPSGLPTLPRAACNRLGGVRTDLLWLSKYLMPAGAPSSGGVSPAACVALIL